MQRLDVGECAELVMLAPGEEPADRMQVGHAGVLVADGGGEEFQEAVRRGWSPASATIAGTTIDAATAAEIRGALAAGTTVSWRVWIRFGSRTWV